MEQQHESTLREVLTIFFKHKQKALLAFFGTVAIVTGVSFLLPPMYEAKSSLLSRFGREYVYRPEFGDVEANSVIHNEEEAINSEIQILNNRDLVEKVIRTIGLQTMYPSLSTTSSPTSVSLEKGIHKFRKNLRDLVEKVITTQGLKTIYPSFSTASFSDSVALEKGVLEFQKNLSTSPVKKSNVIQISFQHPNAQVAARAVNLLVELYRERRLQLYSGPKSSFLENQVKRYEENLNNSAKELETFKQKHGVYSLEEQRSLLLKQRTELASSLSSIQNEIRGLTEKRASLLAMMQPVGVDIPAYTDTEQYRIIDDAKTQLLALRLKEKQLLEKYPETSKFVVDVRNEIKMVEEFLRKQEVEIRERFRTGKNRNELYQTMVTDQVKIEADLSAQEARAAETEQQLRGLDEEIKNIDSREKELQALRRRLATSDNNYKIYLTKLEEAKISENMDALKIASVNVIHAAAVPVEPIKPRKALNIGLSVILGALLAVSLTFFSESAGQKLTTPNALEKQLKLPVLASVKAYRNPIADLNGEMVELYESIESSGLPDGHRIIQFISSAKGEGTTTIVQKFANFLATRLGKSVLLLDTNYNDSGDCPYTEAKTKQGLELLTQGGSQMEKALFPITDTGIYVGALSKQKGLFPFFGDAQKIDQLWEIFRNRFAFVLIDSPAVSETPEGLVVGRRCDGIVLLVEADKTRWPVAASVRDKIGKHHGNLLGVVLNKQRYHIPGWIYRWI